MAAAVGGPLGGGRARRKGDASEVDERQIDALSVGDRQPPRAVGGSTAGAGRDAG